MARYNEILVGRFNKALTKLFSIKGTAPAPQCSSEIAATIELEQVAKENRFLLSVDSYAVFLQQAGVAATLSTIKFRNPVGSNVVAIFEKISAFSGQADSVTLQQGTNQTDGATLTSLSTTNNMDPRSGRVSSLILSASGAAAPPSMVGYAIAPSSATQFADFIADQNQEILLLPGRSMQIVEGSANISLNTTWFWRERLLEESERQ
jgi:hypothetical protein